MAAVWLSILLLVGCFSSNDAASIKESQDGNHNMHEARQLMENLLAESGSALLEQLIRELGDLEEAADTDGQEMDSLDDIEDLYEDVKLRQHQDDDDDDDELSNELSSIEAQIQEIMGDKDNVMGKRRSEDRMPDSDDEYNDAKGPSHAKQPSHQERHMTRGESERLPIPFWNKTHLCNYHDCFSQLKTWPEVPYYLLKDGNFEVDWPTRYIRIVLIYNRNAFVKVFNKDRKAVENHAMELVSIVDKGFRTINFRLLLSGVEILEDYWPGEEENPDYPNFLKPKVRKYIWEELRPVKKFDTAAFITGPPYFHGINAVGAGMGDLCVVESVDSYPFIIIGSSGIITGRPAGMMDVLTHEMGHQFFLGHPFDPLDGGYYPCPAMKLFGSTCTMGGNEYPKSFGQLFFRRIKTSDFSCLNRKPPQTEVFKCGNGVLDHGEECDCGSSQDCLERDLCCDGQICKLKRDAQCADGQTCCKNCKMDLESCPVDSTSSSKRAWVPLSYTSPYTEITSPPSGNIEAIPYGKFTPQNKVFSWLLRAPVGKKISIKLMVPPTNSEYFEVWIECPYDWIEVRDGGDVTSPLIGRYCTPLRTSILSSSNELLLRLRSDSSFDSHFIVEYTFDPQGEGVQPLENDCVTGKGTEYRGTRFTTVDGRLCQEWDSQSPHSHSYTKEKYPDAGLDKNYCRNPSSSKKVWCWTTDPDEDEKWDWCPVPKCDAGIPDEVGPEVQDIIKDAGDCYEGNGDSYRGKIALTWSGRPCQAWSSQTPHSHSYTPASYPNADLTENYCRNPKPDDKDEYAPWCYTTTGDPKWDYCAIPKCLKNTGD